MDPVRTLERVRYWQGQLLSSRDLRTQMRAVAELRRQHNQAVHSAYGVAIGLAVDEVQDGGMPVSCGLAYDCAGRELVVPIARTVPLPVPAITGPTLLTLAFDPASGNSLLGWRAQAQPDSRDIVALARILPGTAGPSLDPAFRPIVSRPIARPRLASGQTVPGDTAWLEWDEEGGSVKVGVETTIDTSAAGFTTTPNYFAEVAADTPGDDYVPAWFTSIMQPSPSQFTLRLFMRGITRESFDLVDAKSGVTSTPVPGAGLELAQGGTFAAQDVVSRLLPIGNTASIVKTVSGITATVDPAIDNLADHTDLAFGNPPRTAMVDAAVGAGDTTIHLDQSKVFAKGDMVARVLPGGGLSNPVRVGAAPTTRTITLDSAIDGLVENDQLVAADYRVRATVLSVADGGGHASVANASLFPPNSFAVHLDDTFAAIEGAQVGAPIGNTLVLTPAINSLQPGSILALCSFPVSVQVASVDPSGTAVQVLSPGLIQAGDVVGALANHTGVAIVSTSIGASLQLATPIPGLTGGDTLAVLTVSGVVDASPGTSANKINLAADHRIRPGDFLATIAGWRESGTTRSLATVTQSTGTHLRLAGSLDGVMAGDTVGLASISGTSFFLRLRLQTVPASVVPGDEVLLVAPDRLTGQTVSVYARVFFLQPLLNVVYLFLEGGLASFTVRPEDLAASVLFLRGSPLALVQNLNLFVNWLACQNPDPMPRPCPDDASSDDPCEAFA